MKIVPTLTLDGLVSDENLKLVKIYTYFLTTLKSQSLLYEGYIVSYDATIKGKITDSSEVSDAITGSLYKLYGMYYNELEVDVDMSDDDKGKFAANIRVKVTVDGVNYYLQKALMVTGGSIKELDDLIDYFRAR